MLTNIIWPNASIIINQICNSELEEIALKGVRYHTVNRGSLSSYTHLSVGLLRNRRERGQVVMRHQKTRHGQESSAVATEAAGLLQCMTARKGSFNFLSQLVPERLWLFSLINIHFLLLALVLSPHMFMRQWTCVPVVNTVVFTHGTSVPEVATTVFKLPKIFHYKSMFNCF